MTGFFVNDVICPKIKDPVEKDHLKALKLAHHLIGGDMVLILGTVTVVSTVNTRPSSAVAFLDQPVVAPRELYLTSGDAFRCRSVSG